MKRRRFISFVFVLILCFGMSGCGKEKKTTAPNKFQSDYMEVWGGTTVEEGDFRVINGLLYYIDFETMEGSGIDYPKEVYKHDLETSENEICISEEEAKAAFQIR